MPEKHFDLADKLEDRQNKNATNLKSECVHIFHTGLILEQILSDVTVYPALELFKSKLSVFL